jgi:TRAP-type C4-dicarboxylate transport system substrate-binding protein
VFPAIQSGVVDGAICCTAQLAYTTFAVSDVGKYFIPYGVFIEGTSYYASKRTWDKMTDEQRAAVAAVFEKASREFTQWNLDEDESYRAKLVEAGYEILDPSPEERAELVAHIRETVWPEVGSIVGQDILDRLLADN